MLLFATEAASMRPQHAGFPVVEGSDSGRSFPPRASDGIPDLMLVPTKRRRCSRLPYRSTVEQMLIERT
jgi:hypothetical protein